jgi:hypothetical protein
MDDRDRLAFYPSWSSGSPAGSARAMGLTDWPGWQPNSAQRSVSATCSIGSPMTACGERRRMTSEAFQPAASTCRTSTTLGRPTCPPGSSGCVSWSATIDGWRTIEVRDTPHVQPIFGNQRPGRHPRPVPRRTREHRQRSRKCICRRRDNASSTHLTIGNRANRWLPALHLRFSEIFGGMI